MKNNIDSCFAFAVLMLVAACIGFSIIFSVYLDGYAYQDYHRVVHPLPKVSDKSTGECVVTGCSSHICSDEMMMSTCEWTEAYACYQSAQCARQADGDCGWTQTPELESCLAVSSMQQQPSASGTRDLMGIVTRIDRDSQPSLVLGDDGIVDESGNGRVDGGWYVELDSGDRIQTGSGEVLEKDFFTHDISHIQPGDVVHVRTRLNEYAALDLHCDECFLQLK